MARAAFDQLSGEIHASIGTALIEDSRHVRNAAMDRIRAAFEVIGASTAPVEAHGPNGATSVPAGTQDLAAWSRAYGSWGKTDGDGNAARLDRDTGGFLMGADALVAENWRLGLLAGYSHSSFHADARGSSGSSDNYHLGLYGGARWGDLALRTGAAYTWHAVSTDRSAAFSGYADSLEADYDAGTAQVFAELGYAIPAGGGVLEPFANLAYVNVRSDDFSETGGGAALSGASVSTDTSFTTLGLRASGAVTLGSVTATAKGLLGWRHASGNVTPFDALAFAGGDAFPIAGVPVTRDAALIEAGLDVALSSRAMLGISYAGQLGSGFSDQSVNANLDVRF